MDPAAISPFTRSGGPASDLWYVTNGQAVVGPVGMELLLRGIHHGRVSDDCYIAQSFWQSWRPLDQVREIRALRLKGSIEDRVGRPETDAFQFAGIQIFGCRDQQEGTENGLQNGLTGILYVTAILQQCFGNSR